MVSTQQNATKREKAAVLLAEDELTDEAIASAVGVHRVTFAKWKTDPEFAAMVGDKRGDIIAEALKLPIAKVHERVRILNDLLMRNLSIIDDRAKRNRARMADSPESAARAIFGDVTPPEAAYGLLVERPKIAANGKTVVEWAYDTALEAAIRNELDLAAKELGQREENVNIEHSGMVRSIVLEDD